MERAKLVGWSLFASFIDARPCHARESTTSLRHRPSWGRWVGKNEGVTLAVTLPLHGFEQGLKCTLQLDPTSPSRFGRRVAVVVGELMVNRDRLVAQIDVTPPKPENLSLTKLRVRSEV
jgi:hypothetical protein